MILPIIVRRCLLGTGTERPFALGKAAPSPVGVGPGRSGRRCDLELAMPVRRLHQLPRRHVCGRVVPVASGFRSRFLGLAWLSREQAGTGLLLPRCASVHTFGMRFELDLLFLDADEILLAVRRAVPPRRLAWHRGAAAVLEIPARQGGESAPPGT
jgi:uncharacterized membrane protein (UPF0127 family)